MRHSAFLALPCFAIFACAPVAQRSASQQATSVAADRGAERNVVETVDRLFEAMRTRDTVAIREMLSPTLVLVSSRPEGGGPHRSQTVAEFVRAIASSTEELRERMWSPEVRLDGPVATLWAPYDFHVGARFSHCGHDAVQLVQTGEKWIITGLSYTARSSPCPGPPTGR